MSTGRKRIGITGAGGRIGGLLAIALAGEYDLRLFVYDAPITNKVLLLIIIIYMKMQAS